MSDIKSGQVIGNFIDNGLTQFGSLHPFASKTPTGTVSLGDQVGWYEAMARAWGSALDDQAGRISEMAGTLSEGNDSPSQVTMLTAESLRMQFLSNSASTAQNAVGHALEKLASRQ